MQYYGVDWLAKVCGLAGVYLLGNKNKIEFSCVYGGKFKLGDIWDFDGERCHDIGSSIFFFMHLRGWMSWSKETVL